VQGGGALILAALAQVDAVAVPGGAFTMGADDEQADADERPVRRVEVAAFRIDRTEVTRGAYAACVAKHACRALEAPAPADASDARRPVVGVSHDDARAYCRFAGGRLPTEAEWEKAARGTDSRRYPWGDAPDCARANFGNFQGSGPCPENPGRPEPVGARPAGAGPYGTLDMAGNVWEWVADAYPGEPRARVLRGGSCCGYFSLPRTTERLRFPRDYRDTDIGFRCAYDVSGGGGRGAGRTRRAAPRPGGREPDRAPP
jgi:formylglycine-generating enzyme required for sulfatase activity